MIIALPFTHHLPASPLRYVVPQGSAKAEADPRTGVMSVVTSIMVAGEHRAWAHIGKDFMVHPAAVKIAVRMNLPLEYYVEAWAFLAGYASAEASVHLILWNASGVEAMHEVRSIYRAQAAVFLWPRSGTQQMILSIDAGIMRAPSAVEERWHVGVGLQSISGTGGTAGGGANATANFQRLYVDQVDGGGRIVR
jgi:hypothetical protein